MEDKSGPVDTMERMEWEINQGPACAHRCPHVHRVEANGLPEIMTFNIFPSEVRVNTTFQRNLPDHDSNRIK